MLDITAETKKVREDMEKQGYVLTEEEYQIILEYTIRKSDRCGKGRDYVPLLLEDEIKNYYFRNTVTAISLALKSSRFYSMYTMPDTSLG